jgi:serine/threonine-protein kinase
LNALRCPRCGSSYDPPARFCIRDGTPLLSRDGRSAAPAAPPRASPVRHRTGEARARRKAADPASGLRGRVLGGRYNIEERVGEGGMAYVYRATDQRQGRTVAVKVLMTKLLGDPESVARIRREAALATKLDHPNVCGLLDHGTAGELPYLVMPFLQGETLANRENRLGPMPLPQAIPILVQLARGLQHAHDQGVLHRDLKPENVMLIAEAGGERAVVMDFGLAKESAVGPDLNRLTATGIVLGTPEFMSPEQIRGKPIDQRSDVYALAVLAFELITAELPFTGRTAQETMLNHLTGRPRSIRDCEIDAPDALERVIVKALALDPADRFQSMEEFREALSGLLASHG